MIATCLIRVRDVTHSYSWTWLVAGDDDDGDMTHSYLWHDPFASVTWRIQMCERDVLQGPMMMETWLIRIWTWIIHIHGYLSLQVATMMETWLIRICDMTRLYLRRDPFILVDMTRCRWPWRWRHDSFVSVTWLIYTDGHDSLQVAMTMERDGVAMDEVWFFFSVTWRIHICDMTHLSVRRDSFVCETRPFYIWDMTHSNLETWLIRIWDATPLYERHDSVVYETWLSRIWDMTHSYMRHDSVVYETWLIRIWDMTHSYMRHDSFVYETWRIHM